jgi:transcriptional regulator with XRE-family HTH domain
MNIGEKIREYRRRKDFTQAELAEQVGINKQNISRYESGKSEPRKSTLQKLADALEVSTDELLGLREASADNQVPQDPRLLNLLNEVDQLPAKDKEALIRLMNIVVREHRIQSAIAS